MSAAKSTGPPRSIITLLLPRVSVQPPGKVYRLDSSSSSLTVMSTLLISILLDQYIPSIDIVAISTFPIGSSRNAIVPIRPSTCFPVMATPSDPSSSIRIRPLPGTSLPFL